MRDKLKHWIDNGIINRMYIREAELYELDTLSAIMNKAQELTGKEPETLLVMAEAELKGHKSPHLIHGLWSVIERLGFHSTDLQMPNLPFQEQHLTKKAEPVTLVKRILPKREPKFVPVIDFFSG